MDNGTIECLVVDFLEQVVWNSREGNLVVIPWVLQKISHDISRIVVFIPTHHLLVHLVELKIVVPSSLFLLCE